MDAQPASIETARGRIMWLKTGIWKLRRIVTGFERGRCPLCLAEENAKRMLFICSEMEENGEENLCVVNRYVRNYDGDKNTGKCLFRVKCK